MYRQSEKKLLNSNTSSACPDNMVNFGLLTVEICWRVWGTPANFNGLRDLAALLHGTLVVGVSQTAALNRGRHLYSAGRPSRLALAHISSFLLFYVFSLCFIMAALWNRAGYYIFVLWFLSFFLLLYFFFHGLISAAADWMSTIHRHMMWP